MADGGKAREVKVVLLGDTGVGKSSLVLRFVTNNFRPYSESTIGASFMSKMIVVNDTPIKYQIWDTAGQEKVRPCRLYVYLALSTSALDRQTERSHGRMGSYSRGACLL